MLRVAFMMLVVVSIGILLIFGACVIGRMMENHLIAFSITGRDRIERYIAVADVERGLNAQIPFSRHNGFALSSTGVFALSGAGTSIITFDSYGSNRGVLIEDGEYDFDYLVAAWSPDGTALAFVNGASSLYSDEQIYLWQQNTVRNLMPEDSLESIYEMVWSPDGTQIAFVGYPSSVTPPAVYTLNVNTNVLRQVSPLGMFTDSPSWSPDSGAIAFAGGDVNARDIFVVKLNTGETLNLTNDPSNDNSPAWSPDGTQIAFTLNVIGNFQIYLMDTNGDNLHLLTDYRHAESNPVWSPDGEYIAFITPRPSNGALEIQAIQVDGSARRLVSYNEGWADNAAWIP
jgi:Tol biopolymer transport system component